MATSLLDPRDIIDLTPRRRRRRAWWKPALIALAAATATGWIWHNANNQGEGFLQAKERRASWLDLQIDCHAINIYHEARGESIEGQRRVFEVVQNRAAKRKLPPCGVIFQPNQFSWTLKPTSVREPKILERIRHRVAFWILEHEPDPQGVDHYHRHDISPAWNRTMQAAGKTGNHVFFAAN